MREWVPQTPDWQFVLHILYDPYEVIQDDDEHLFKLTINEMENELIQLVALTGIN